MPWSESVLTRNYLPPLEALSTSSFRPGPQQPFGNRDSIRYPAKGSNCGPTRTFALPKQRNKLNPVYRCVAFFPSSLHSSILSFDINEKEWLFDINEKEWLFQLIQESAGVSPVAKITFLALRLPIVVGRSSSRTLLAGFRTWKSKNHPDSRGLWVPCGHVNSIYYSYIMLSLSVYIYIYIQYIHIYIYTYTHIYI